MHQRMYYTYHRLWFGAIIFVCTSAPPFLPTIVRQPASGRDLMTSPYHSKITIILFPRVLYRSLQPQSTNNILVISF